MPRRVLITLISAAAFAAAPAPAGAAIDTCDRYASLTGSDSGGDGSRNDPWATVDKLLDNLNPGEAGCLLGAGPFVGDVDMEDGGGDEGSPVTLRSDGTARVAIRGKFWIRGPVTDVIVAGLKLDGGTFAGISLPIDGDRITLLGNEITKDTSGASCLYAGAGPVGFPTADDLRVEGNLIHGCSHGVQLVRTRNARVIDNTIYENQTFGVFFDTDADGSRVEQNVVTGNGNQGVQFAGTASAKSDSNTVFRNVITNNAEENLGDNYQAGMIGTGNVAKENCLDGDAATEIEQSSGGFIAEDQVFFPNPGYEDAGSDDYTLDVNSPCARKGPLPGVELLAPDAVGNRTARLQGEINPHFQPVGAYFFRYGPNGNLSSETSHQPKGGESLPAYVNATLDNLQPGTTYTYQLVARNPSLGERMTTTGTFATQPLPDADSDGVPDETDACDNQAGPPFDTDHNGCPDDSDADGVLDAGDACRTTARGPVDRDGNGCPDDSDADGVADERDACDLTVRGLIDRNGDGCPDDSDGDSVVDERERCLTIQRGPFDVNGDGCPDDSDGDGLIDADDRCRRLAAGRFDDPPNGCPGPMPIVSARGARVRFYPDYKGSKVTAARVLAVRLTRTEKGSRVQISCKRCKIRGKIIKHRAGAVNFTDGLPRKTGKRVSLRSVITIRVTKAGKAGRQFDLRWNRRQRAWLDTERCIPIGSSKAQPLRACGDRTE